MSKRFKRSRVSSTINQTGRKNKSRPDDRRDHTLKASPPMRYGRKMPPVVKKSEIRLGAPTYSSKFIAAKTGGLMAAVRVHGRIVFPDRKSPQPVNDGKPWAFEIVGENPKQTVYFARIVDPRAAHSPLTIVIDPSGKMRAIGRLPVKIFHSTKQPKAFMEEFRHASPNTPFDHSDDDDFFGYGGYYYGDDGVDDEGDESEISRFIAEEIEGIESSLRPATRKDSACWNMLATTEDGTGTDWVPRTAFSAAA